MTAPAASHDARCRTWHTDDPAATCSCRPSNVVPLGPSRMCAMCAGLPEWVVGTQLRSCSRCLPEVLSDFYVHGYDGFSPAVVAPLSARGGAA